MIGDSLLPMSPYRFYGKVPEFGRYAESLRQRTLVPTLATLYINKAIGLMAWEALMEHGK